VGLGGPEHKKKFNKKFTCEPLNWRNPLSRSRASSKERKIRERVFWWNQGFVEMNS